MKIYYQDLHQYKYRLTRDVTRYIGIYPERDIETEYIKLTRTGFLTIKAGYAWDGATGAKDTGTILPASLIHDALCQLCNAGLLEAIYRERVDMLLREICKEDGMIPARRWWVFRGVRHFAWIPIGEKRKADNLEEKTAGR
jgi:hypothetical protein